MPDEQLEGMETPETTALGFGGKTIERRLHLGDEMYLLLVELTQKQAAQIVVDA